MSGSERRLPPHLTEIYHHYVRERDAGRTPPVEELLAQAGEGGEELRARIERYESAVRIAASLSEDLEKTPERIDRFRIETKIGEGGGGRVYLAHDPKLNRRVALKVLDTGGDSEQLRWVLNEARSLARIEHPGVLGVYEVGEAEGSVFVVTEHLTGPTLAEVIEELRRLRDDPGEAPETEARRLAESLLPYSARLRCLEAIAGALGTCHDMGVLHRDVKPGNVVFDGKGEPRLIDFGLAHLADADEDTKLDITQRMVGTPGYTAPEQVESGRTGADPRSDQFSFGTLCYELLTLEHPFHRETRSATLDAVARARPLPLRRVDPLVPEDAERVVLHALERSPEDRYANLAALAADLECVRGHRPISVEDPSAARVASLWIRRNRRRVLLGAGVLAVVLGLLGANWFLAARAERRDVLELLDSALSGPLESPDAFHGSFETLYAARLRAEAFDGSLARRIALGGVRPRVDLGSRAWSGRLGEVLQREEQRSADEGVSFQVGAWNQVLRMERLLLEDSPATRAFGNRGRVDYPWDQLEGLDWALYQQVRASDEGLLEGYPVYRTTHAVADPVPGIYRLIAWDPGTSTVVYEREFARTTTHGGHLRLGLVPPAPALAREFRACPRHREDTMAGLPDQPGAKEMPPQPPVTVPGFRILERRVTSAEVLRYLEEEGLPRPPMFNLQDLGGDAWVPIGLAEDYAASVGCRLPTAMELATLFRTTDVEPPGGPEWVSDLEMHGSPGNATYFDLERLAEYPMFQPVTWVQTTPRADRTMRIEGTGIGFRLALTDDTREGFEDAAFPGR